MTIESVLTRQAEDKSKDLTVLLSPNDESTAILLSPQRLKNSLTMQIVDRRPITRTKPILTPEGKERLVILQHDKTFCVMAVTLESASLKGNEATTSSRVS